MIEHHDMTATREVDPKGKLGLEVVVEIEEEAEACAEVQEGTGGGGADRERGVEEDAEPRPEGSKSKAVASGDPEAEVVGVVGKGVFVGEGEAVVEGEAEVAGGVEGDGKAEGIEGEVGDRHVVEKKAKTGGRLSEGGAFDLLTQGDLFPAEIGRFDLVLGVFGGSKVVPSDPAGASDLDRIRADPKGDQHRSPGGFFELLVEFVFEVEEAVTLEVRRKAEMGLCALEVGQKEGALALEVDVMGRALDFDEVGGGLSEGLIIDVLLDLGERDFLIAVFVGSTAKSGEESRGVERAADPVGFVGAFAFAGGGEDRKAAHAEDRGRGEPADRRVAFGTFGAEEGTGVAGVDDHQADLDGEFAGEAHDLKKREGFGADLKVFLAGVSGVVEEEDALAFGGGEAALDRFHGGADLGGRGGEKKEDLIAAVASEFLEDLGDPDRVVFGVAEGLERGIALVVTDDQGDAFGFFGGVGVRGAEGEKEGQEEGGAEERTPEEAHGGLTG